MKLVGIYHLCGETCPRGAEQALPPHPARWRVALGFGEHHRTPRTPEASKQCFQAEFEGLQGDACPQLTVCWSAGIRASGMAVGWCHGRKVTSKALYGPIQVLVIDLWIGSNQIDLEMGPMMDPQHESTN